MTLRELDQINGYEVIDVDDLPLSLGSGHQRSGLANALRNLPLRLALFVPMRDGETVQRRAKTVSAGQRRIALQRGLKMHTRADHDRQGVWVWFTEETS